MKLRSKLSWAYFPLQLPPVSQNPFRLNVNLLLSSILPSPCLLSILQSCSHLRQSTETSLSKVTDDLHLKNPQDNPYSLLIWSSPHLIHPLVDHSLLLEILFHFTVRTDFIWLAFLPSHWPLFPDISSWICLFSLMFKFWDVWFSDSDLSTCML